MRQIKKGELFAFWNPYHKCFIKMTGTGLTVSPKKEDGILPSNWDSEVFLLVDAGYDKVAFWNPYHKCFIKMTGTGLTVSPKKEDGILPSNWDAEVFAANKVM